MKKTLLICNTVLYAIMHNISLFYSGFKFGWYHQHDEFIHDGALSADEYPWSTLYVPVLILAFFFVGLIFIRERDNLTAKAFVILGVATWAPSVVCYALVYMNDVVNSSVHAYTYWFLLGLFVIASVIFIFDIICAIHTYREDRILKKKFDTTS